MSQQDDVLREMRRVAGLPVDDTSEEVVVVSPRRDAGFVLKETQELAGLRDYQAEDYGITIALSMGDEAGKLGMSLGRLASGLRDYPEVKAAADKASKALKEFWKAASQAGKERLR